MTSRLADLARRPGTAINCRRMAAVVALAWKTEAMVPAARVRLNAIAAMISQAALDANFLRVVGPELAPDLHGERGERQDVSAVRSRCSATLGSFSAKEFRTRSYRATTESASGWS